MTRSEKENVARELHSERLMTMLVQYGRNLADAENSYEREQLDESIDVLKAELRSRITGVNKEA